MSGYRKRILATNYKNIPADADTTLNISSQKWLSVYSLKKLKLNLKQVLSTVGFRNCDDFISILRKPVSSRYSEGLFKKVGHKDGVYYNIIASKDGLCSVESKLEQVVDLYKKRLEWLTTGSRRTFGVIEEKNACILYDVQQDSQQEFNYFQEILASVIREQLPYIRKFNIVRVTPDLIKWQPLCSTVNTDNVNEILEWLSDQNEHTEYSLTSAIEAVLDAAQDKQLEAIYLFTDGSFLSGAKDIFLEKIKSITIPLHLVYVPSSDMISPEFDEFLREITSISGGRYHKFSKSLKTNDQPNIRQKGEGVRPDIMMIWEELDAARNTLFQIKSLISDIDSGKLQKALDNEAKSALETPEKPKSDVSMDSKQWLQFHGLKKLKLNLHTFLKESVFNHCDGVLDTLKDEAPKSVIVNAQYCKRFAHMTWSDGSIKHVQVTEAVHRKFREKMALVLGKYKKRLEWLQKGSRELFGTVVENKVVLMIDTSASMESRLHIVKGKLVKLFKEQFAMKESFNVISFNSKVLSWRDNLVPCSLENLQHVIQWIEDLHAQGSTNTFGALTTAYEMSNVEAIYLLSDGRPDQPADLVLSHIKRDIPIHTISFNCADPEANEFLYNLAEKSKGRYHYFSEDQTVNKELPTPYESEDLMLIRQEIEKGSRDLEAMLQLRNECSKKSLQAQEESGCTIHTRDDLMLLRTANTNKKLRRPHTAYSYNENRASLLRNGFIVPSKPTTPKRNEKETLEKSDDGKRKKKKKNESEIKKWLKKHGLAALNLTILDALAPTIIKQKPTYVPLLGKEVLSKVYGDILPIVHTSDGKEFQLVNPQAVDLLSYEEKLKYALQNIEAKLNDFVLQKVSEHLKERFLDGFSYSDHKEEIQKDLEESPAVLKDIKLLEKELNQGNVYLNQSKDLRDTMQQLSKQAKEEREKIKEEQNANGNRKGKVNVSESKKLTASMSPKFRYHRVIARSDVNGYYYSGVVSKFVNPRFVNVLFDYGENQLTCVRYLIPIGGSAPCPTLNVGDYVFVKCLKYDEELGLSSIFYVPGIVQVTPLKMKSTTKCYTVIKYNSSKCTALRKDIIKISRSQFVFSVKFIQELHNPKREERQRTSSRYGRQHRKKNSSSSERTESTSRNHSSSLQRMRDADNVNVIDEHSNNVSGKKRRRTKSKRSTTTSDSESKQSGSEISDSSIAKNLSSSESVDKKRHSSVSSIDKKHRSSADSGESEKESNDENDDSVLTKIGSDTDRNSENEQESSEEEKDENNNSENKNGEIKKNKKEGKQSSVEIPSDVVNQLRQSFEEQHAMKMKELEEQKTLLIDFHEKLTQNQAKQSAEHEELEKERIKLYKEKQEFLERQLKFQNDSQELNKDKYKDLSEMQLQIFRKQHEQQELLFQRMLEKEKELLQAKNTPPKTMKDEETYTSDSSDLNHDSSISKEESPNDLKPEDVSPRSNSVLMTKEDTLSRSPLEHDPSVGMKKVLSVINANDEVLCRFKSDGWYYRGIVKQTLNNNTFLIEDGIGEEEEIPRYDIITDADDADNVIEVQDYVIALHPSYLHAYAPGIVADVNNKEGTLRIHFYDGQISTVPRTETYLISPQRYDSDCHYIKSCEYSLIGQAVVCRSNKTGEYCLGMVRDKVAGCRNYLVEWADQSLEIQNFAYIFGSHTRRREFVKGSHILAVSNQDTFCYLPGTVVGHDGNLLQVQFCDSKRIKNVDAYQSFWISEEYFQISVDFWKERSQTFKK